MKMLMTIAALFLGLAAYGTSATAAELNPARDFTLKVGDTVRVSNACSDVGASMTIFERLQWTNETSPEINKFYKVQPGQTRTTCHTFQMFRPEARVIELIGKAIDWEGDRFYLARVEAIPGATIFSLVYAVHVLEQQGDPA